MDHQRRTLQIEGMHCGHCVEVVEEALAEVDDLSVEQVDIGTAQVSYDPYQISEDQLAAVIDDAGYELNV